VEAKPPEYSTAGKSSSSKAMTKKRKLVVWINVRESGLSRFGYFFNGPYDSQKEAERYPNEGTPTRFIESPQRRRKK
jgi:hypothetical protein